MGCKTLAQHLFITHRGFEPRVSLLLTSPLAAREHLGREQPAEMCPSPPALPRCCSRREDGGSSPAGRSWQRKEKRPPLSVLLGRGTGGSALAGGMGRCLYPKCLFLLFFQQGFRKGPKASIWLPSSPLVLVSIAVAAQAEKSCSQELQRLSRGCNIFP